MIVAISATYIAANPMMHQRTEHIEINQHFLRDRILVKQFIASDDQLAGILTKSLQTFMEGLGEVRTVASSTACKFSDAAERRGASKRGRNEFPSPTSLLDSSIMLLNTHDLPSPTTGTFPIYPIKDEHNSLLNPHVMHEDGSEDSYFTFTPHGELTTLQSLLRLENQEANTEHEGFGSEKSLVGFEFIDDNNIYDGKIVNEKYCENMENCISDINNNQEEIEMLQQQHSLESEEKGSYVCMGMLRTSEDGYNWRKYGQKQVKGSEYPRSYYKCTRPNCLVKKKVERSLDGQITEIIYKGAHNHSKPDSNRRPAMLGSPVLTQDDDQDQVDTQCGVNKDIKLVSDNWSVDGDLERTSLFTELSDPQGKTVAAFDSFGTPELSFTLATANDDDDLTAQGSFAASIQPDDAEPEFKRRRKEDSSMDNNLASRCVRETRVVIQIETEVDILEDGYRWRKYGQKVVKGNPNPRSYYKCTSAGCLVRKHVERASDDLKCVITTYEGKHNHQVPASRNSGQVNSSNANAQSSASRVPPTMGLSRNSNIRKSETQIQDLVTQFYPKPDFNHDYQRSSCFDTFSNDMKLGAPSFCPVTFPTLQNTMLYSSFGLNSNHITTSIAGSLASFPLRQNLSPSSFDFSNERMPIPPLQVFQLAGQQLRETDRFLTPKQEHGDDHLHASFQPIVDSSSRSTSSVSSVYQQIMGNFS